MEPFETQVQQDSNPVITDPVGFPAASSAPKKKSKMWIVVLILFVIAIAVITFIVFKGSRQTSDDTQSLSPTSLPVTDENPTPEPTATTVAVSKDNLKVQVLNGTGVAGEAALLQTKLKNLGYTNVDTGNATETTTTTTVAFGSTVSQDVITEVTSLLKKTYTSVVTSNTAPTGFDIQITVGTRTGATSATAAPANTSATTAPTATPAQ